MSQSASAAIRSKVRAGLSSNRYSFSRRACLAHARRSLCPPARPRQDRGRARTPFPHPRRRRPRACRDRRAGRRAPRSANRPLRRSAGRHTTCHRLSPARACSGLPRRRRPPDRPAPRRLPQARPHSARVRRTLDTPGDRAPRRRRGGVRPDAASERQYAARPSTAAPARTVTINRPRRCSPALIDTTKDVNGVGS
jgi:hypothetical protein